jgi:hypothetical protein
MTKTQAIKKAQQLAKKNDEFYYVVLEDAELDDYGVASEYDLDTFFLACPVIATLEPDGAMS